MGKPAARLLDMTAHGGMITGPGCPTVLIGKMPAARMTDMHVCPMCNGPVPHVGGVCVGPVPPTVFIGKLPAACVGDMFICTGPPATALPPGCPTVLIGQAGGGGGSGGGGGTSSAAAASPDTGKAPKKVKGLTAEGIEVTEVVTGDNPESKANAHRLDLKLLGGTKKQSDGAQKEKEEKSWYIDSAVWDKERCWFGETVELKITAKGLEAGTEMEIVLYDRDETNPDDFITVVKASASGEQTTVQWKAEFDAKALYEEGEGDDFEVYPIVKIPKYDTAAVFRLNLLYVDVVRPGVNI